MFILLIDDGPDLLRETGHSWTMGRMRVNGWSHYAEEDNGYLPDAATEEIRSSCIHDWQEAKKKFSGCSPREIMDRPTRRFHKMSMGLDAFLDDYISSFVLKVEYQLTSSKCKTFL